MSFNEPPPVYSSLTEMDKIHFRGEEKKKSLWLSPFTARKEPKKFAIFHIVASIVFFGVGVGYGCLLDRRNDAVKSLLLSICVPPLPLFLCALFGIVKRMPNFLLPIAVYMITSCLFVCVQLGFFLFYSIFLAMSSPAWMLVFGWISFGSSIIPLLYTSHAARLYLRVRDDIADEIRERKEETKTPLVV